MKIGVIGTFINDQIHPADGSFVKSFGGIFYTLSILVNLISAEDKIYPICPLGEDIYDRVIKKLSIHKSINLDYIIKHKQKNTNVKLFYQDFEKREEIISDLMPEIQLSNLEKPGAMDAWLVNFITGFEMSLETFTKFCQQQTGKIFMDFHSLSLGVESNGKRFPQRPDNWEDWITGIDCLQMNENEANCLINKEKIDKADLIDFGNYVIQKNLKTFHITRGSKGSLMFYRNAVSVQVLEIPAFQIQNAVDVTGSGDAFLSGYATHFIKHHDPIAASRYANFVAGKKCTIKGTEKLHQLRPIIRQGLN